MQSLILAGILIILIILVLPIIVRILGSIIGLVIGLGLLIGSIIALGGFLEFIEANAPNLNYLPTIVLLAALILTIRDSIRSESRLTKIARKWDREITIWKLNNLK